MIVRLLIIIFISLALCFSLSNCANIKRPTGGEKDTLAPVLVKSIPENGSLNFKGTEIELTFNEYINLNTIKSELIISPTPPGNYKHNYKKETVTLTFDSAFEKNTTYTFQFRKAVKDITEGNTAKNLRLAFSTGDYIDSLKMEGRITNLLSGEPVEGASVMLFKADDSAAFKGSKPVYITETDQSGQYLMENLPHSSFKIFALTDENNNLKFNGNKETAGFLPDPVTLTGDTSAVNLSLFNYDNTAFALKRTRQISKHVAEMAFNKTIDSVNLIRADSTPLYYTVSEDKQNVFVHNYPIEDSITVTVDAVDTYGLTFTEDKTLKFKDDVKIDTAQLIKSVKRISIPENLKFIIQFKEPVTDSFKEKIQLIAKNDTLSADLSAFTFNKYSDRLTFQITAPKTDSATLLIDSAAFKGISGSFSAPVAQKTAVLKKSDFGIVRGTVKTEKLNYFIRLIDENIDVIKEITNVTTFSFENITPGTYSLQVLIDNNGNGKWENGNIDLLTPPEDVILLPDKVNVKANWEINDLVLEF